MSVNYGVPYMGSKSAIAPSIIAKLPPADVFVDLFAGGCAMTHAAMLSGKYKRFIANDIGLAPKLFCDAVQGKYHDEKRWISREDFFKYKDTDPYIAYVWSFGNNPEKGYMYSPQNERIKKALWSAFVLNDFAPMRDQYGIDLSFLRDLKDINARRRVGMTYIKKHTRIGRKGELRSLERLQSLQSLESLERLQSLQSLERLERLERLQGDYRNVIIPANAVVYCDPPYRGTVKYNNKTFDHEAFYDWCRSCGHKVFISEYSMPADFKVVATWRKTSNLCATSTNIVAEHLYTL